MLDTSGVKAFLPGITDTSTLEMASKLCGQAAYREHGQEHCSRYDVVTADMIRQLPAGFALVIRGGQAPVIARLPRAWKDRAYKRARRRGRAVAALTPAPVAASLSEPVVPAAGAPDFEPEPGLAGNGHRGSGGGQDYAWSRGDD